MGPVLVVRFDQLAAVLAPAPVLERPSGRRALDRPAVPAACNLGKDGLRPLRRGGDMTGTTVDALVLTERALARRGARAPPGLRPDGTCRRTGGDWCCALSRPPRPGRQQ
jgi:hypothetical protein